MRDALISTLLHVLELLVPIAAAIVIVRFFQLGSDDTAVLIGIVLNALSKFGRANGNIPDAINDR